jgi:hypothetical protein
MDDYKDSMMNNLLNWEHKEGWPITKTWIDNWKSDQRGRKSYNDGKLWGEILILMSTELKLDNQKLLIVEKLKELLKLTIGQKSQILKE